MTKAGIILLIILVGANSFAKDTAVSNFFKDKTKIENPFDLRDPFKAPHVGGTKKVGSKSVENKNEDALALLKVQDIKVRGVLIGKERRAIIQALNNSTLLFVKEGMKIGPDKIEVKAILPGGMVLVEKFVNVYGQEEYLETVIPISK
jgi:hypothetical protein